jgi:hypothetical protein
MIGLTLTAGLLLPVYLYALIGTGAITLTLLNIIGVVLLSALSLSVVIAIATLSKAGK